MWKKATIMDFSCQRRKSLFPFQKAKKIPAGKNPTGMEITENVIYLARRALRAAS